MSAFENVLRLRSILFILFLLISVSLSKPLLADFSEVFWTPLRLYFFPSFFPRIAEKVPTVNSAFLCEGGIRQCVHI